MSKTEQLVVVSFEETIIVSYSDRKRLNLVLSLWEYHNEDFENGAISLEDYKLLPDYLENSGFGVVIPEVVNLP